MRARCHRVEVNMNGLRYGEPVGICEIFGQAEDILPFELLLLQPLSTGVSLFREGADPLAIEHAFQEARNLFSMQSVNEGRDNGI